MKTKLKFHSLFIVLACLVGVYHQAAAQSPVISSFSKNGQLVCTNLAPGSVASVEWASSLSGPWYFNWMGLDAVTVDSNGVIQVGVPMFYRVSGVPPGSLPPPPTGMALIPAGSFTMGDNLDGELDAMPTLNVYVSAFYMDQNLVSLSQWQSVYYWATNHGYGFVHSGLSEAANHPVETVDWHDAAKWSNARSQLGSLTPAYYTDAGLTQVYMTGETTNIFVNWAANGFRLPTEAEWEKAARGGLSGQRFPWGNVISEALANYLGDTQTNYDLGPDGYNVNFTQGITDRTSPVGYFGANGYGLYDMAGNAFEWCWDWLATPYAGGNDPHGPDFGTYRVIRGGSWFNNAYSERCAYRSNNQIPAATYNSFGFRCVRAH